MRRFDTAADIFAFMEERGLESRELYRQVAQSVVEARTKALLDRLAHREEIYRSKLEGGRRTGTFTNKSCSLPDRSFFKTIPVPPVNPGRTLPEILIFAIKRQHDGYLACREAAKNCKEAGLKKIWLALAEEERINRLELESFYEKEVIGKI